MLCTGNINHKNVQNNACFMWCCRYIFQLQARHFIDWVVILSILFKYSLKYASAISVSSHCNAYFSEYIISHIHSSVISIIKYLWWWDKTPYLTQRLCYTQFGLPTSLHKKPECLPVSVLIRVLSFQLLYREDRGVSHSVIKPCIRWRMRQIFSSTIKQYYSYFIWYVL